MSTAMTPPDSPTVVTICDAGHGVTEPVFVSVRVTGRMPFVSETVWVGPEKEGGRFGEGPLQVDVADLAAGGAKALAGGLLGALDQTGIGSEVLHPGEAVDVVDLIEDHQREGRTDPMDGA